MSVINVWKFLIPVLGAGLSWLILENEQPDITSVTGMIVIAFSLITLSYSNRRETRIKSRTLQEETT